MKGNRFLVLAMAVIFTVVVVGCAGQGEAGDQGGIGSASVGAPGAQQTDMPGTGETGATGAMSDTASSNTDTGVTGSGTGQGTGSDASSGTSAGTSDTGATGSGTSNTGGTGATGAMTDTTTTGATGAMTDTTTAGGTSGLSGNFMGRWNFAMLDGFTVGSTNDATNLNTADAITMTGSYEGDSYVIELQSGDAGDASSLDEWVTAEMDAFGSSDAMTDTQSATVGNFDATTLTLPQPALGDNFADATCAVRSYVWGMGNAAGAGNSDDSSNSSGSDDNGGSDGSDDNNAKNLLVVTVYQTSGDTCNADQVMTDFLSGFKGGESSFDGGSDDSGAAGTATGTTTP